MRTERALPALVYLAAVLLFVGATSSVTEFPLDDAWIFRVYARALAHGEGFAYDGVRQEAGATSPLWVIATAPAEWFEPFGTRAVVGAVKLAGVALGLAAVLAAHAIVAQLSGSARVASLAACLFALEPRLLFSALSGMETPLLIAAWSGALAAWLARRHRLALCLLAALPVTRPEALILLPLALPVWIALRREAGTSLRALAWLCVPALPALAWMLFCLHTTGHPLPNTFYLKAHPFRLGADELRVAGQALGAGGLAPAWLWLPAAAGFALLPWRQPPPRPWTAALLLSPLVYLLAVAGSREISFSGYYWTRWLEPASTLAMLPFCAVVAASLVPLGERIRRAPDAVRGRGLALAGLGALCGLLALPHSVAAWRDRRFHLAADARAIRALNVEAGLWIARNTPPDAVVAVNDAGAIRYFGRRRTLDLVGLNDADIAFGRVSREDALRAAGWLAIFPALFERTPLAPPIAAGFMPRASFEISPAEYTVCDCPAQTLLRVYERMPPPR